MKLKVLDALTLTVSTGRSGKRPTGVPLGPLIILGYPPSVAQALTTGVLLPHAQPTDVLIGYYRHHDGKMTIGCYLVITVPKADSMYIIGTARNMSDEEWAEFNERRGEFGQVTVTCGALQGTPTRAYLTKPPWFITTSTFFYTDVIRHLIDLMVSRL